MALDKTGKPLPKGITWRENKQIYMIRFSFQGTAFTFYEKTLKDAKKTLAEKRYQVEHGELGKADKVSLNAWYETWLTTYKIPYTPQMIATITRQQIGTVERAIKIFLQLGLMEQMPDGAFYMSNIELLIGQSSTEGERKRRARQANRAALNPGGQMSALCADICPPEIEIGKERELKIERELRNH